MRRAVETAEPIARFAGRPLLVDGRLQERMNWDDATQSFEEFVLEWRLASEHRAALAEAAAQRELVAMPSGSAGVLSDVAAPKRLDAHDDGSDIVGDDTKEEDVRMTKLNQIVAIEKAAKADANRAITDVYHQVQKPDRFAGIARTYEPLHEDGEKLPPESTRVQLRAEDLLATDIRTAWTRLLDLVATKDAANSLAKADIKVGETVVATDVPVTYLIWLEKQLVEMATVIGKLPVLDNAFVWTQDSNGDWATAVTQTVKTKKVPRNHVKAEATDKHPAQVEMYFEDIAVGTWSTIRSSGAMPASRQRELLGRIAKLQEAVKMAREDANNTEVVDQHVGGAIFDYLLA